MLLAPLALVPMPVAVTLLTTVTIALTALVLRIFLRSLVVHRAAVILVDRPVAAAGDAVP